MSKGLQARDGWIQLAIAVGYALAYMAIRPYSGSQWTLTSGLRMACLLFLPYRYWPALAVGEVFPLAYTNYKCMHSYGPLALAIASFPPIITGMPLVWWCRSRWMLFPSRRLIDVQSLLLCSLLVSIAWSSISYLVLLEIQENSRSFKVEHIMSIGMFIGNYLAILTIVPFSLLVREEFGRGKWKYALGHRIAINQPVRDGLFIGLPMLGFLAWLSYVCPGDLAQIARMAMFMPVAWLTLRYGWRASVMGGTVTLASICALLICKPDPEILQARAFMAITITGLYALGARISSQMKLHENERSKAMNAKQLALRHLHFGELRMRHASQALECVIGVLRIDQSRVLDKLKCFTSEEERDIYGKESLLLQQRIYHLAESIHPSAWRERGLSSALHDTIGRVLHEAGVSYRYDAKECRFGLLAHDVQVAVYRAVCEAVACVSSRLTCSRVRLAVRDGVANGRRWVVLLVDGVLDDLAVARAVYHAEERERVAPKLGAHALEFEELRDFVRLFDGELRIRVMENRIRVTALLQDVPENTRSRIRQAAPVCLWVN